MVCRALLARRSPPRLSRRRWVLPEETSTGLTPHNAAKDASLWRRSGLSPAGMSNAAAVSGPTPLRSRQLRGMGAQRVSDLAVQIVDLRGQFEDPAGQQGE